MAYGTVYKIQNTLTKQLYIGQTTQSLEQRFKQHEYASRYNARKYSYLHKSINKYGIQNFQIAAICYADNQLELNNREQNCIRMFKSTTPIHFNIKKAVTGHGSLSLETKQKLREAHLGKKRGPHTEETKLKIRKTNLGKKRSLVARQNMSLAHAGNPNLHVCRKIAIFKNDILLFVFNSISSAADYLNVWKGSIDNNLAGRSKTFTKYKYTARYI